MKEKILPVLVAASLGLGGNIVSPILNPTKVMAASQYSKGSLIMGNAKATFYSLRPQECGKQPTDKGFGITASGYSLKGKSLASGERTIAVDSKKIPLGTVVYVQFNDSAMQHLSGYYTARDTGVSGNRIDIFVGDENTSLQYLKQLGLRDVSVYSVNK